MWQSFLGWVVTTRGVLAAPEGQWFVEDVGRFLVGYRERVERALAAADANLAEAERFVRRFVFGDCDAPEIPDGEPAEPGASEAFEF